MCHILHVRFPPHQPCPLGGGLGWAQGTMYLMGAPDPPTQGAILREQEAAHCKVWGLSAVSPAKTAEPTEMPFGGWTRVGPGNYALDVVHIGATWRIRLNRPHVAVMRPYVKLLRPLVTTIKHKARHVCGTQMSD